MDKNLGALVADARERQSLTQVELGKLIDLDDAVICKIEKGERPLKATELLALTLLFPDWFEFRSEAFMDEVIAEVVCQLRLFIRTTKFAPDQTEKRDWLERTLIKLDHGYAEEGVA